MQIPPPCGPHVVVDGRSGERMRKGDAEPGAELTGLEQPGGDGVLHRPQRVVDAGQPVRDAERALVAENRGRDDQALRIR